MIKLSRHVHMELRALGMKGSTWKPEHLMTGQVTAHARTSELVLKHVLPLFFINFETSSKLDIPIYSTITIYSNNPKILAPTPSQ